MIYDVVVDDDDDDDDAAAVAAAAADDDDDEEEEEEEEGNTPTLTLQLWYLEGDDYFSSINNFFVSFSEHDKSVLAFDSQCVNALSTPILTTCPLLVPWSYVISWHGR